jgi:acetate kinase
MREVLAWLGPAAADVAFRMFCYRRSDIGAYAAAMGGVDACS